MSADSFTTTERVALATGFDPFEVYQELGYVPHAGQVPVLRSTARMRVVSAGRRFGKSNLGGNELTAEACLAKFLAPELIDAGKRREFWIVGPEYTDSEKEFRVLWNNIRKLEIPMDKPGSYNNPEGGFMHLSLWGGAFQVHAKSAKHPDTLVGEGLHGVVLAEAAKLKEKVWIKFVRPMLADFDGWALLSSTPEGKNWFYARWQDGQNPALSDWASWRVPSWMNPFVYKTPTRGDDVRALIEMMKVQKGRITANELAAKYGFLVDGEILSFLNDLTPEAFLQEIGADFTEFVGRVFKEFDEEWHVGDLQYDRRFQHYAAMDSGYTNPSVWLYLQVDPWGNIDILDELYETGLTPDEFAAEIQRRGLDRGVLRFYPDPAAPGDNVQVSRILKIQNGGGTGGELQYRIDAIRQALRVRPGLEHLPVGHPERLPRLRIDRKCVNTIREFGEYRYPDRRDTILGDEAHEKPMKKDDHTPEALGRFFAGFVGTPDRNGITRNGRSKIVGSRTKRRM
jgi:hypothetical protein